MKLNCNEIIKIFDPKLIFFSKSNAVFKNLVFMNRENNNEFKTILHALRISIGQYVADTVYPR